jgi:predicted RND superfamily exporter protein
VDFALEGIRGGMSRKEAIANAGRIRLRPILMTTFAMLAGTLPVAFGIGEAAKYRVSMGIAIIGGLVVSTIITLVVVPAVFEYIDRFREFVESKFRPEPDNDAELEDKTAKEICDDLRLEEKDCHERLHISQDNGHTAAVMKTEDDRTALKKRKKSVKKKA